MYQEPSSATGHYSQEMEGYLLGKRRFDQILLKNDESQALKKGAAGVGGVAVAGAAGDSGAGAGAAGAGTNPRDTMRDDRRRSDDRGDGARQDVRDRDRRERFDRFSDRRDYRGPRGSYNRDRNLQDGKNNHTEQRAKDLEQERQRKLAEMLSNADEMEETRRQRIAEVTAAEQKQLEEDEKHRSEKGRFVSGLHRQLQEDNLDDRLKRSRGGLARLDDDE
ncbi:hypothetical protein BP00DRAFT_212100 [Aspergillus indologenus CBS 114.80]|uniref:Uncharacterized protein n=1 Tax=Aspergillus indologenus CBS 114.80 TaxID=1450541 RepID=A0A2V5J6Y9_9EURO|nr:hypothetical protein BP00DRAFT_212100 [Aspergillus indologenus CBS 114.80]